MGLPDRWDTCSRTIPLEDTPSAFACWGDILAIGLKFNVVLLDAITGSRTSVLCDHMGRVDSLTFSLDGTLLVSSSSDNTVKLWDVQTGGVVRTFSDNTFDVSAASISLDGATIALGTRSGAIHLWDVQTGKRDFVEMRHDNRVTSINFSTTDPRRLLSSSRDGTVRQWGVDGHQIGTSYREANGVIMEDLAYTPDGTRFITFGGGIATIRDSGSGEVVGKFHVPGGSSPHRCCFSPDGRFVACAAGNTISVWDITLPEARFVGRFIGHSAHVTSLAFSSSLVSASQDRSLKFWQSSSFLADSTTAGRTTVSTPIMSARLLAQDGILVTSDESGMVKTWDLITGVCKSSFPTPAKGVRDTHLVDGTLITVWWMDKKYHSWDVHEGQPLSSFHSTLSNVMHIKISGDGSKIFGQGNGCIEAVSTETGEAAGRVEFGFLRVPNFFVRGSKVGIGYSHRGGWDFGGPEVCYFAEFPDRLRLDLIERFTICGIEPCWIEDTEAKRRVFRLPERYAKYDTKVEWDGRYLVVWSSSREMMIMDFDFECLR